MKVLYEKSFLKDLKKRKEKTLKKSVESVISEVKEAEGRNDLKNIEKLKGHDSAYKIRIGDYRMGKKIIFSRLLHQKEIYKNFHK